MSEAAKPRLRRSPSRALVRSEEIKAHKSVDEEFLALLRRKCIRAATIGALTATGESIPGMSRVLGFVFGELLDVGFLGAVQRELIEETFKLYAVKLPKPLHETIVRRVQMVGASASVAGDAVVRRLLQNTVGKVGGFFARRALPLTAIASSALTNATITYAIGKRAQSVARLRDTPITGMPDALRAFSGIDERRMYEWTLEAVKSSFGIVGDALRRMVKRKPASAAGKKRRTS